MMEFELIAVTRADGGVSMMSIITSAPLDGFSAGAALANGFVLSDDGMSWARDAGDDQVEREIVRAGIDCVSWRRVPPEIVPNSRMFRDAWVDDGKDVSVDMPKAREIAHKARRGKRELEMSPLDKQINIDAALPAKVAATEAKRQTIRDKYAVMQSGIDAAKTADELQAILNG